MKSEGPGLYVVRAGKPRRVYAPFEAITELLQRHSCVNTSKYFKIFQAYDIRNTTLK